MLRDIGDGDFVSRSYRLEDANRFAEHLDGVVWAQVADRNRDTVFGAEEHGIFHSACSDRELRGSKSTVRTKSLVANKSETILNGFMAYP